MTNVQTIRPELRDIHAPAPLRDLPIWLVWRYEPQFEGDPKPLKVPYYPLGNRRKGRNDTGADRAGLTTFAVARDQAAKRGMSGVGMALLEGYDLVALDFDNCVVDGRVPSEIEQLVRSTYCEYSPSGNGIRAILRGNLGNRKSPTTPDQFGAEVFSTSGYVTITGNALPFVDVLGLEDTIGRVTPEVEAFCAKRFGSSAPAGPDPEDFMAGYEPKLGLSEDDCRELIEQLDPDLSRDEWIRVGFALHHEFDGDEDGFALWDEWSSAGSKYPGEDALRTQWDSFTRRVGPGRKQITMATVKKMVKEAWEPSPEALREVAKAAPPPIDFDGKFPARQVGQLGDLPQTQWLVKGVLPASRDPVILFGASGAGKSFIALDVALSVARGTPWREHRVKQGRVCYVAAEGGSGILKRVKAYCDWHNLDMAALPFDVVTAAPNILDSDDVSELVKTIATFGPYTLVVIDTFAQVTPGANENAGEDMGRALANIKAVQDATGATICVVHHAGKDLQRGSRGWSGLKAAAEAQIEVLRDEDSGARQIHIEKMKDGEDGARYGFKLEVVQVGVDEDGDAVTSCVALPAETPQPVSKEDRKGIKRRGRIQNHVLEVMALIDPSQSSIRRDDLIKMAVDMLPEPDEGQRDTRRQHVARAIEDLSREKDGPLKLINNIVVLFE